MSSRALPLARSLTGIPLQQTGVLPAAPGCCANAALQFLRFAFLLVLTQRLWDLEGTGGGGGSLVLCAISSPGPGTSGSRLPMLLASSSG